MYYLIYGSLYLISLLPLRILFVLSDGIYGLIYYVIKYRRDVVMKNLTIAFPQKTEAEKKIIAKKFYHNFIDSLIETLKVISVSDKFLLKHFVANWEVLTALYEKGESCEILMGHTFNWEWGNCAICLNVDYTFLAVYMPIANKTLDRVFLKLRSRGKSKMLSAHHMKREIYPYRNSQYALGLAADQNPGDPSRAYWLNFFGKPAPFVTGPEKGARTRNMPVIFCYIEKPRRGYYKLVLSMGVENPQSMPEGAITLKFARYLEDVIRLQPEMWLWSHKRWKHEWREEYADLWVDEKPVKRCEV